MKKIIKVTILLFLSGNVLSQNIISEDDKRQFLSNYKVKLTPSQIFANYRAVDIEGWLSLFEFIEKTPFESAFNLNVFDYFKLKEIYDSNLKKELFKKTNDYTTLLDSLKRIKFKYLNSIYFETGFINEAYEMESIDNDPKYELNYDILKKGFFIEIGKVLPYHCSSGFCPKVINLVEFKQLTITKKYNLKSNSNNSYTQYLFIPMDEITALEIENNRSQIEILRIFNITGTYTATFNDKDFLSGYSERICKTPVIIGGNMRLLMYNKSTEQIYFDKIYPTKK